MKKIVSLLILTLMLISILPVVALASDPTVNVEYLYPVYKEEAVATSGILEWKTTNTDACILATDTDNWDDETLVVSTDTVLKGTIEVTGVVNLILANNASLTVNGCITTKNTGSLNIYAQSTDTDTMGSLLVVCDRTYDAGIGGSCPVTINGGYIKVSKDPSAPEALTRGAGIGGGYQKIAEVIINGGVVESTSVNGAAIGTGKEASSGMYSGYIVINGGEITAISTGNGAGIGGGQKTSAGSNIYINGGTITASGSSSIGNGNNVDGDPKPLNINPAMSIKAGSSLGTLVSVSHEHFQDSRHKAAKLVYDPVAGILNANEYSDFNTLMANINDGDEIKLLKNITDMDSVDFKNKEIHLNLNGHILTCKSGNLCTNTDNVIMDVYSKKDMEAAVQSSFNTMTWNIKEDITFNQRLYVQKDDLDLTILGNDHTITATADEYSTEPGKNTRHVFNFVADNITSQDEFIVEIVNLNIVTENNFETAINIQSHDESIVGGILILDDVTINHTNARSGAAVNSNNSSIIVTGDLNITTGVNTMDAIGLYAVKNHADINFLFDGNLKLVDNRTSSQKALSPVIHFNENDVYEITASGDFIDNYMVKVENIGYNFKPVEEDTTPVVAPQARIEQYGIPTVYIGENKPEIKVLTLSDTYQSEDNSFSAVAPIIIEQNRTFLGIRDMATVLGIAPEAVKWNDKTKTATISKSGATIEVTQGSKNIKLTYKGYIYTIENDVSAINRNDRIYLPFRVIFELFGYTVDWNNETRTITCK